jgi:hypothetical protein
LYHIPLCVLRRLEIWRAVTQAWQVGGGDGRWLTRAAACASPMRGRDPTEVCRARRERLPTNAPVAFSTLSYLHDSNTIALPRASPNCTCYRRASAIQRLRPLRSPHKPLGLRHSLASLTSNRRHHHSSLQRLHVLSIPARGAVRRRTRTDVFTIAAKAVGD